MAKLKIENKVLNILLEGLKIYFLNIGKFTKYMLFPVFGQVLGIFMVFAFAFWFVEMIPSLSVKYVFFNNFTVIALTLFALTIPGFAIFMKAFWDYLVAYGALNSMTEAVMTTGKLYDLKAHTQVITQRAFKFVLLLLAISVLSLVAINPLFWIIGLIFFVYFVLIFQVFTFEAETTVTGCFKRSLELIKGNFGRTVVIMIILSFIGHYLLNMGTVLLFNVIKLSDILRGVFETWTMTLPLDDINAKLVLFKLSAITPLDVANNILSSSILFVVGGLTLPMRSVCWTLWYKNLVAIQNKTDKKSKKDN